MLRVMEEGTDESWMQLCWSDLGMQYSWGLLETAKHTDWYNDRVPNYCTENYCDSSGLNYCFTDECVEEKRIKWYNTHINLQEIATRGPSGVRLGMMNDNPPTAGSLHHWNYWNNHLAPQKLSRRSSSRANFNYNHTIGQPVCGRNFTDRLRDDLTKHFSDVFVLMTHSIHEAPVSAYCSSWALEYALLHALEQALDTDHLELTTQRERVAT